VTVGHCLCGRRPWRTHESPPKSNPQHPPHTRHSSHAPPAPSKGLNTRPYPSQCTSRLLRVRLGLSGADTETRDLNPFETCRGRAGPHSPNVALFRVHSGKLIRQRAACRLKKIKWFLDARPSPHRRSFRRGLSVRLACCRRRHGSWNTVCSCRSDGGGMKWRAQLAAQI
jgi:hypothetical protein